MSRSSNSKGSSTKQNVSRSEVLDYFYTKPSKDIIQDFLKHVRETGHPETYCFITRVPPSKNAIPVVLCRFDVERKKRLDLDMAPCSICSPYHPKCLENMYLVWYHEEGTIRAIGPECGKKLNPSYSGAFADYKQEKKVSSYEETIHKKLPKCTKIINDIDLLYISSIEVDRIHSKFKRKTNVAKIFNNIQKSGGILSVEIEVTGDERGAEITRYGPAGLRSSSGFQSENLQTHEFGQLLGLTLFQSNLSLEKKCILLKS